jgi:formamidopyrimidine-DNA glycosylase
LKVKILPELPEVETTRKGIEPFLAGQSILRIEVRNSKLRWPVSEEINAIRQLYVEAVLRRGKYIIMQFRHGSLLVHLGMSGSMRIEQAKTPLKTHDHVVFQLSEEKQIRFNDPRRFGSVLWTEDWQRHPLIASLGPEPLSESFNAEYLYGLAKQRSLPVKQFIMNSHIVVGVGNIYANEALFLAGIHPNRKVNRISSLRFADLVCKIKQVLTKAIEQGGTTLRDFIGSDGKPGYFQQQLFVYGRAGEPCKQCAHPLKEIRMNARSTVFCPDCQT